MFSMSVFDFKGEDKMTNSEYEHVKFISYDGKYPNLCSGRLVLEIDGEIARFSYETRKDYEPFWRSGGSCTRRNNYRRIRDAWEIEYDNLPDKFKKYANEIDAVFNQNVEYGCCGGCA